MKIVFLLGSPRPEGNSSTIAGRLEATAAALGARTRMFKLNRLNYRGCQGCYACKKKLDRCILEDDLTEVLAQVAEADAVVLATPVYYGDVSGQLKCFIDRTFSYLVPDYITNPSPSRLAPGKKLVFIITQGQPDEALFSDIFPRYTNFMKWYGFAETRLIRACGIGPASIDRVPEKYLLQADEVARTLVGQGAKTG
ncbi:MAG TPA: flavodoxin family protein [Geobacteraceae bacterium]